MGMTAILVMWPRPFEPTFVPPSQGGSVWNLALIGPLVLEEMFENVDIYTHIRTTEAYLYYKLTNEPKGSGELTITILHHMGSSLSARLFHEKKENYSYATILLLAMGRTIAMS